MKITKKQLIEMIKHISRPADEGGLIQCDTEDLKRKDKDDFTIGWIGAIKCFRSALINEIRSIRK